jgi:hypothetical protein
MQFDFVTGFTASAGDYCDFIFAKSFVGWDSLLFSFNGLGAGLGWQFESVNGGMRLEITDKGSAPVPEPSTMMLLGSGLAGLAGYGRRRFKK